MPVISTTILIAVLGAVIGSFLNALIFRHRGQISIADGRSKCPHCHHELAASDLIPILSYLLLKGKCRYCGKGISVQYPLVEFATALLFVLAYWQTSHLALLGSMPAIEIVRLARDLFAVSVLMAIFVYDLRYMEIPDAFSLTGIALIFFANCLLGLAVTSLIGAAIGFGFFAAQYFLSKGRWIGGGDLRLGALMGALLGWPNILAALFIAYVGGAIIAIGLMAAKKADGKTALPFGTFLVPAAIIALFFGQRLMGWYLGIILP